MEATSNYPTRITNELVDQSIDFMNGFKKVAHITDSWQNPELVIKKLTS